MWIHRDRCVDDAMRHLASGGPRKLESAGSKEIVGGWRRAPCIVRVWVIKLHTAFLITGRWLLEIGYHFRNEWLPLDSDHWRIERIELWALSVVGNVDDDG